MVTVVLAETVVPEQPEILLALAAQQPQGKWNGQVEVLTDEVAVPEHAEHAQVEESVEQQLNDSDESPPGRSERAERERHPVALRSSEAAAVALPEAMSETVLAEAACRAKAEARLAWLAYGTPPMDLLADEVDGDARAAGGEASEGQPSGGIDRCSIDHVVVAPFTVESAGTNTVPPPPLRLRSLSGRLRQAAVDVLACRWRRRASVRVAMRSAASALLGIALGIQCGGEVHRRHFSAQASARRRRFAKRAAAAAVRPPPPTEGAMAVERWSQQALVAHDVSIAARRIDVALGAAA